MLYVVSQIQISRYVLADELKLNVPEIPREPPCAKVTDEEVQNNQPVKHRLRNGQGLKDA